MDDPFREITRSQREFVRSRPADLDGRGWTVDYRDNLFQALHPDTLNEFIARDEVMPDGRGDRISAPHSSTALAVNTFDWWRGRDLSRLSGALGIRLEGFTGFEQQHGFGRGRPAQLDVEFVDSNGTPVGVEVKLREPYGPVSNSFADRYFETPGLWDGLSSLETLARRIRYEGDPLFVTLHAAQLIKHMLGMRHSYGEGFTLVYFWHRMPGSVGDGHAGEVERFAELVQPEVSFGAVTVGELLERFQPDTTSQGWYDYIIERYLNRERH